MKIILPSSCAREGMEDMFLFLEPGPAERAEWLLCLEMWNAVQQRCAESSLDELVFWDNQCIFNSATLVDEDNEDGEFFDARTSYRETQYDYGKEQVARGDAQRLHLDNEGLRWSWFEKHTGGRYCTTKLPWSWVQAALRRKRS
jgi:hypothetical protein